MDWERFRQQMPVAERWAYFDHAAVAPLSGPARAAIAQWLEEATCDGDTAWPRWAQRVEQVRTTAASIIGSAPEEIALVPNTTTGISLVAEGYPWAEGDNVVTLGNEFPSNLYPWMNLASRGVETRPVQVESGTVDIEAIRKACDRNTRLISVSWVGYASGWRLDLDRLIRLAHHQGILVFLDAIQGLGVFPLDVEQTPIDFLAADGHKWMLGPEGAGLLYVRREHLELLRPLGVGWHSVTHAHDFTRTELNLREEAARYEGGSQNMIGFLGLGASLDLLVEFGLSPRSQTIANRVLELTELACERLRSVGARVSRPASRQHASGIVSFEIPGRDPAEVRRRCLEAGVVLSCRAGRLRISPHAYVNETDIERLAEAVR